MTNSQIDMQKTTTNMTHNGFGRGSLATEIIQGGTTVADRIYQADLKNKKNPQVSRKNISPR